MASTQISRPEVRARYMAKDFGAFGYDIAVTFERWLARATRSRSEP